MSNQIQNENCLSSLDPQVGRDDQQDPFDHAIRPNKLVTAFPLGLPGRLRHQNPAIGLLDVFQDGPVGIGDRNPWLVLRLPMALNLDLLNHQRAFCIDETREVFW